MPKEAELKIIGVLAEGFLKRSIKEGPFLPNAPGTAASKQAKSYKGAASGSAKPLIDTGYLLSSITHKVKVV